LENRGETILSYIDHTIGAYLRRNIVFPFYWKYIKHSNVLNCYKELRTHQWNTLEENQEIQRKKLYSLIEYASENIPYYNQLIKDHHIRFSEDTIFKDIKKIPLLTKDIIRNNFDKLYKFRDNTYYTNSSGGSTGEPVVFYQDKDYLQWAIANKYLFNEWAGRQIGEPMVKIWGSLSDTLRGGQNFKGYLRQQISGVTVLNSNKMTEEVMYGFIKKINNIKPCLILTYTSSIDELARFIQEHHLSVYSPPAVMTTAGVLHPEVYKRIKKVFATKVFNRYGSREVSDIACNCEKSNGLHLNTDIHYLEIVDEKGKEVKPGKEGNIVITLLTNYTMPLIRYKIGDKGILSAENSQCGHGFPLLKKVSGRIKSIFINKFGDFINDDLFFVLFRLKENVKKFQIIQESIDYIIINLVLMDKTKLKDVNEEFKEANQTIRKVMGEEIKIKYNIVDEIKPSPSGKFMYAFSQIKK
jgi:phenylacetate-CoA ligase